MESRRKHSAKLAGADGGSELAVCAERTLEGSKPPGFARTSGPCSRVRVDNVLCLLDIPSDAEKQCSPVSSATRSLAARRPPQRVLRRREIALRSPGLDDCRVALQRQCMVGGFEFGDAVLQEADAIEFGRADRAVHLICRPEP